MLKMNEMNDEMITKYENDFKMADGDYDKIQEITTNFEKMNIANRDYYNIKKMKENTDGKNEKTIKQMLVKIVHSKNTNSMMYAPTQVGKSEAMFTLTKLYLEDDSIVIISTDNKTDQQEQIYCRADTIECNKLKVSSKNFAKELEDCLNIKKKIVVFVLDNAKQIEKLINSFAILNTRCENFKSIKKIAMIHDEADTIAKDSDTEKINPQQALSHKKWIEMINMFNKKMGYIDLKRTFVTATPENCMMLNDIKCEDVVRLIVQSCYTGYKDIRHVPMETKNMDEILPFLSNEVDRINKAKTCEAIIYNCDKKIADGQDKVLKYLSGILDCVVSTYNSRGITTYQRTLKLCKDFEAQLIVSKLKYTKIDSHFVIRKLTIRKFYKIIKQIGENCIVTIGKDLICRGLSYVGEDEINPITATTMFYIPGPSMHAVGICQTIGRITGNAMPKLVRRIYTSDNVFETYVSYNKNQNIFMKEISNNESLTTKYIIDNITFDNFYTRKVDRPKLKLEMKMKPSESKKGGTNVKTDNRLEDLIDNWYSKNENIIIRKILLHVNKNKNVDKKTLMLFIEKDCKSKNPSSYYNELVRKDKNYNLVFTRDNNDITSITKDAIEYIKIRN